MDRRDFVQTCVKSTACLGAGGLAGLQPVLAADAKPKAYARVLLTNEFGEPLKASSLAPQTNYVFNYPFEATPVFLLDLGQSVAATALSTRTKDSYQWPGGVGAKKSVVAFSAICAHHLVYPTKDVSFISFRKTKSTKGVQDNLIHCCADHSQYDPAKGAQVLSGPASQPLCAVLLTHDAKKDTLTAYATLGGELFDDFFKKYDAKLSLEVGGKARQAVTGQAVVKALDKYCRNAIQC
ncbi:MAG: (2Fe-2S)-binding protein [Burkholderiaceae bacterium]